MLLVASAPSAVEVLLVVVVLLLVVTVFAVAASDASAIIFFIVVVMASLIILEASLSPTASSPGFEEVTIVLAVASCIPPDSRNAIAAAFVTVLLFLPLRLRLDRLFRLFIWNIS
jgi:hypothetical protein